MPHDYRPYTEELARFTDLIIQLPFDWQNHQRPFQERGVKEIEDFFRDERVHLVHLNSTVIPDILVAARRANVRSVLHARELLESDLELAEYFECEGASALNYLSRSADHIIGNSQATLKQFPEMGDYYCLHNTFNSELLELPAPCSGPTLRVGLIGGNTHRKGISDFIQLAISARTNPDIEFIVIGTPKLTDRDGLELQLKSVFPPPRLKFVDEVVEPTEAVGMVDVVVSLSSVPESFGRTILEAMAGGRPVVAFSIGAVTELVEHLKNGFLVAPGDRADALRALTWLANNRDEAVAMGKAGRDRASLSFSKEVYTRNLGMIYDHILRKTTSRGEDRERIYSNARFR